MSTQPHPPSRTASVGPSGSSAMNAPSTAPSGSQGQNSQQNLNQIDKTIVIVQTTKNRFAVLEYLSKKGYSRTEAMLRRESTNVDSNGNIVPKAPDTDGRAHTRAFVLAQDWVDNVLDIYQSELKRILWPIFVYSFITMIRDFYPRDAEEFFNRFRKRFENEHSDDLRAMSAVGLPEHANENDFVKLYRENKYRITLSRMAYATLVQYLEAKHDDGGETIMSIVTDHMDLHVVDRVGSGGTRGLQKLLSLRYGEEDLPAEDEGIPGHHPGASNRAANVQRPDKLRLGHMPKEQDLMEDVKADLSHEDSTNPPEVGQASLLETYERSIKIEDDDAPPPIPFPPSTARDVAMEVQQVKENRDRFRIESRTGGVGPGVSVTMFTFHNTFDSVNCVEFSGDYQLAAIGTSASYIRVWSLDNRPLTAPTDPAGQQPSSSRRLIGHAGPVYALSFSPSAALPEPQTNGTAPDSNSSSNSYPRYLLSSSADNTIRLWSMDTWTNLVVYRAHGSPVWDVRFSPYGHYFVSASSDRTARLWSTPQIAPLRVFVGHDSDVDTVAWHPNGAYVFTGSSSGDRTVRMWAIATGSEVRLFTGHVGNVTSIACAPNGKVVASADDRGEIILWELQTGRLMKRMRGHGRGGIWSLDWSVESSVLVSGGADRTVRVWDVQPNKETQSKTGGDAGTGAKADGAAGTASGAVTKSGKAKKDVTVSADQISAFPTKSTPIYKVRFTQMNLVMVGGAYLP